MRMLVKSLDDIIFSDEEQQMEWKDYYWLPVGQNQKYALAGNLYVTENPRAGRPLTLSIELPWCWLNDDTVATLQALAGTVGQTHILTLELTPNVASHFVVMFRRDQGPLDLTPIDPRREYFTGTLYFVEI